MATTEHFYTGDGSTSSFGFTFPYLKNTDVKVQIDAVTKIESTHYNISNTNIVFTSGNIPAAGADIHIFRLTDVDTPQAVFAAGSSIKAGDLNNNQTQNLYSNQEQQQLFRADRLKDSSITSVKILDGTIVNADVNASAAIAGTKISPDFGSQNITTTGQLFAQSKLSTDGNIEVDGTVDGRDVAADGTKLDGIETAATADQTASEIKTLYESNSNTNEFSDAEQTKLAGIETAATADQTGAEIKSLYEANSNTNAYTDAEKTKLTGIETGATADQTASEIKTLIASSPLDASHLAANSVTTSEIADAELTTLASMQSGTASILASGTALTSTTTELNQLDGKTLGETTLTNNSDTAIPTSKAVADYVSSSIAPLGGFEVISNEVSFPNTQPAAGVVISISDAGGVVFNGSGVSTTGRTVGGSTVTINGAPSSLNGETLAAGVGLMVSSTGSSQTYNYHKILGKEDDIKQLSDDINDFAERYRVGSTNPTSNNDSGDMFFNTSTGKMLVYNANNTAWEEVQSIGNFFISTFSESFDGSRTAFTVSNPPTNAQQLIISINGVVQKPNSGTGQPSEGFTLSGSTVTFSSAIPSGSDYFVIVLGSTVNIGTPSNNTVTEAILQSNVVSEEKLKIGNSPVNGKFLQAQSGQSGGLYWASAITSNSQIIGLYDQSGTPVQRLLADTEGVTVQGTSAGVSKLMFRDRTTSNYLKFKPVDTLPATVEFTLPSADGSANHYLSTNGSGVLSFGALNAAHLTGTLPAIDGSNLTGLQAGATGGNSGGNAVFWENDKTITHDYTISTNKNAGSFGPLTINNGVTVTVPNNSTWTIV